MKDSRGHGSEAGHGHGFVTPGGRGIMPSRPFRQGTGHQTAIAEQHGVETSHLNSHGHEWGSPAALADFRAEHGGPRNFKAEARAFNSGKREIARLRRQGR